MADEEPGPARAFATLMTNAAQAADAPPEPGMIRDRKTGEWRAKRRPGRPPKNPDAAASVSPPPAAAAAAPPAAAAAAPPDQDRDPGPAWQQDDAGPAAARRRLSIDDVPRVVIDDIAGFAGLVGAPLLAILQQADPYCGSALAQNYEPIVDAVLPLLCRSEKIVSWFTGDKSDWLLWGKLALALAPVGRAIFEHHVARSVEVVRDPQTGAAQVRPRQQGPEMGDHLVPPPFDPSAYAA